MLAFLIRRVGQAVLVMLAVALVAFVMFRFLGDPVTNMLPETATTADREELREHLGLNDSVVVQFTKFLVNAAQGDFGISYRNGSLIAIAGRCRI
jgi:peptide/nickel transport system permease protein